MQKWPFDSNDWFIDLFKYKYSDQNGLGNVMKHRIQVILQISVIE